MRKKLEYPPGTSASLHEDTDPVGDLLKFIFA